MVPFARLCLLLIRFCLKANIESLKIRTNNLQESWEIF